MESEFGEFGGTGVGENKRKKASKLLGIDMHKEYPVGFVKDGVSNKGAWQVFRIKDCDFGFFLDPQIPNLKKNDYIEIDDVKRFNVRYQRDSQTIPGTNYQKRFVDVSLTVSAHVTKQATLDGYDDISAEDFTEESGLGELLF